jgi:hypothetical protein
MRGQICILWQLPWNLLWDVKFEGLDESFQGICFGHVFIKGMLMCYYCKQCRYVSIKSVYQIKILKMCGLA